MIQEFKRLKIPNPELKTQLIFAMLDGLSLHLALQVQLERKTFSDEDNTILTDEIMQLFFGKL